MQCRWWLKPSRNQTDTTGVGLLPVRFCHKCCIFLVFYLNPTLRANPSLSHYVFGLAPSNLNIMRNRHTVPLWYTWGVVHVTIGLDRGFSSVGWCVTLLIIAVNDLCFVHFVWMIFNEICMKQQKYAWPLQGVPMYRSSNWYIPYSVTYGRNRAGTSRMLPTSGLTPVLFRHTCCIIGFY